MGGERKEGRNPCDPVWQENYTNLETAMDTDYCYAACHILSVIKSLLQIKQGFKKKRKNN